MKKIIFVLGLLIIASTGVFAQKKVNATSTATASGATKTSASAGNGSAGLRSGTQISGQLQSALDAKNARVGDQVVLKTTSAIKDDGQVVVQKGAKLIGHVTAVQQKAKGTAGSSVSVLFDSIQQGGSSIPVNAVITSVLQASSAARASVGDDDVMATGSGTSSTSTTTSRRSSTSSGNGGLLGGVGNTVGGVTNTVGQTVGGVTNTAGQTLGSTTQAVGGTVRSIQISQSTNASASGGSTLSLGGGDLRLEKGTTLGLTVSESSSVKAN